MKVLPIKPSLRCLSICPICKCSVASIRNKCKYKLKLTSLLSNLTLQGQGVLWVVAWCRGPRQLKHLPFRNSHLSALCFANLPSQRHIQHPDSNLPAEYLTHENSEMNSMLVYRRGPLFFSSCKIKWYTFCDHLIKIVTNAAWFNIPQIKKSLSLKNF